MDRSYTASVLDKLSPRRAAGKVALLLAATALTLLVAEGVIRLMHDLPPGHREVWRTAFLVPVDDPELQFVNLPQSSPEPVSADGFRGTALPRPRTPGVPRVAVLGDSVTFGPSVRHNETYTAQLGRMLGERLGKTVETINAAVPGYDIVQVAAMYERRVRAFAPDLVIYGFFSNDLEAQRSLVVGDDPPKVVGVVPEFSLLPGEMLLPVSAHDALTRSSYLYCWINLRMLDLFYDYQDLPDQMDEVTRRRGVNALQRLTEATRADNVPLLVALLPPVVRRNRDLSICADPGVVSSPGWGAYCEYNERVLNFIGSQCARLRIPVADLRHSYEVRPDDSLAIHHQDPDHPNALGHRLLAEGLLEPTLAQLVLDHVAPAPPTNTP